MIHSGEDRRRVSVEQVLENLNTMGAIYIPLVDVEWGILFPCHKELQGLDNLEIQGYKDYIPRDTGIQGLYLQIQGYRDYT